MITTGNLVWNAGGSVWAIFRVTAAHFDQGRPAALLSALGGLDCPTKLLSLGSSNTVFARDTVVPKALGAERPGRGDDHEHGQDHVDVHARRGHRERGGLLLSVEIVTGGMRVAAPAVFGAAAAAVLRPFGAGPPRPGPRRAAVQRSAADRLVAGLAPFGITEPGAGEVRLAIGSGVSGWREVRGCGYAVGVSGGRPRYRAWFAAMPLGDTAGRWPVWPPGPAAIDWCVCVRPSPVGASTALLGRIEAGDLVGLGERAAGLCHALREQGWHLVRPGSGQMLLGAAMVPGAANPRLPGSLFFPPPRAVGEPADR